MSKPEQLTVSCPECASRLVVDGATGEVLSHSRPGSVPAGGQGFEDLLEQVEQSKATALDIFEREVAAHEDRDRLLEEKFRQALERAGDEPDDEPPPSPFDFE